MAELAPEGQDLKAIRRAEIAAKVASAQLAAENLKQKEAEQKTLYFGTHDGISCDGCGAAAPLTGYRYRCSKCANHDVCEACFDLWNGGAGSVSNSLAAQKLSTDPKDHSFNIHKDKNFKPLVKPTGVPAAAVKKPKPNEPCSCGSEKKYKKCCGAAAGEK